MAHIRIVLVNPKYEGNIGFAARVMKNFGFQELTLVDSCPIGDEAIARASHARDVLLSAEHCSIDEVFSSSDLVVATTGAVSHSICNPMRMPYYSPRGLRNLLEGREGRISVLFGRENWGLSNEEIAQCEVICTIPTAPEYPIMNISHAVGIICYELAAIPRGEYLLASRLEMEHLYRHIDSYLDTIGHPPYKRRNTILMARRILGRAMLTAREASTIHGLMRRSEWYIKPGMPPPDDNQDESDGTDPGDPSAANRGSNRGDQSEG